MHEIAQITWFRAALLVNVEFLQIILDGPVPSFNYSGLIMPPWWSSQSVVPLLFSQPRDSFFSNDWPPFISVGSPWRWHHVLSRWRMTFGNSRELIWNIIEYQVDTSTMRYSMFLTSSKYRVRSCCWNCSPTSSRWTFFGSESPVHMHTSQLMTISLKNLPIHDFH